MNKQKIMSSVLRNLPVPIAIFLGGFHPRISRNLPVGINTEITYYKKFRVEIDTQYLVEREMVSGTYSPSITNVIEKILQPNGAFIDVGANVGALSLVASSIVGSKGKVISIEPGPLNHQRLLKTIRKNNIQNIQLIQCGISDKAGKLMWHMDLENPGNAGLSDQDGGIEVDVVTLDSLADQIGIDNVSMIKIDVEGMELEVFRGASKILKSFKPVVIFETSGGFLAIKGKRYFDEIEQLLYSHGYRIFAVEDGAIREVAMENTTEDTVGIHSSDAQSLAKMGVI